MLANLQSHLFDFGFPWPYHSVRTGFPIDTSKTLTGPLNMSLLVCAATPQLICFALERRAATPSMVNPADKLVIWVSIVGCVLVAIGGAMMAN